jgi:hypothetical protein
MPTSNQMDKLCWSPPWLAIAGAVATVRLTDECWDWLPAPYVPKILDLCPRRVLALETRPAQRADVRLGASANTY